MMKRKTIKIPIRLLWGMRKIETSIYMYWSFGPLYAGSARQKDKKALDV